MNELFPHRFSRGEEWDHEDGQDNDACGCAKGLEGWAAKEQGCRQGSYTSKTEEEACLRKKKVRVTHSLCHQLWPCCSEESDVLICCGL